MLGLLRASGEAIAKHVWKCNLQEGFLSAWQNCRCVDCSGFCIVAFANLSQNSPKGSFHLPYLPEGVWIFVCVFISSPAVVSKAENA